MVNTGWRSGRFDGGVAVPAGPGFAPEGASERPDRVGTGAVRALRPYLFGVGAMPSPAAGGGGHVPRPQRHAYPRPRSRESMAPSPD